MARFGLEIGGLPHRTSNMSVTPHPDLLHAGLSPGSVQTLASRARPPPTSNPITSKRVCFYKSGDPQFGGLRMVINGRTFKTYDALLDALSKKVPLPFGVRTITTPRGTNSIRALEEFQDGGSYVCSDQKRIKPLNLEQANRRQVPWNTTRPISAKRRGNLRQIPRRADFGSRAERMIDRNVTVRTPKRLVVYKNRDPTVKRIVVLQRKTAPTFDALLDYLCQVMQFPVVKLFTPDGRRVEGLAGLILCSGVVVAAGNEPFRLLNFNFQGGPPPPTTQSGFLMDQIRAPPQICKHANNKKKSPTSSTRSRKFSLSSERYFVNQIKKSLSESLSEHESHHSGSLETELNQPSESVDMEPCVGKAGVAGKDCPIMPTEDDIEKSFRVNQDGSMTVEMKVRLTIKQEEMIHWTTTLSRTSVSCQQTKMHATQPVSGPNSPDVNNDSSRNGGHSAQHTSSGRTVAFKEQEGGHCNSALAETSRNLKHSKRTPTPGPRRVKSNNASVENITTVTETEVQESTVGTYSYMERTSEGEVTEGYCVVRSSSTSNIRPVPKPRKTGSAEAKQSTLHSSLRASGVSEVLQIQKSGLDVTETFMHIYEPQPPGSYDNYLANPQHVAQKRPSHSAPVAHSKPGSTDSGPCSSNNDCDVDLTRLSSTSDSNNGKKDEMFSLSSESMAPQQTTRTKLATGRSTGHKSSSANEDATHISPGSKKKRTLTSRTHKNASPLSSGSDKKQRTTQTESSKTVKRTNSSDNIGKTGSSAESAQSKKTGRVKKREKDNNGGKVSASKSSMSALSAEQGLNLDESAVRDLAHNLNSSESEKPKKPKRKNVQDILVSHQGHTKMSTLKQKSMSDDRVKSPKQNREINESISLPRLCSPPSVQQYVETWLQQMQPDSVPYLEELNLTEAEAGKAASKGSWENSASEIISEEEENLSAEDKSEEGQEQQQPTQSQLCVDEPYGMRGLCRSMPSVRVHPAEQDCRNKLHQSAEVLFPLDTQPSEDVEANLKGGMKPVLQQLCSSLQSIRRVVIPNQADSLEKAHSLPDFSVQVASVFGASSAKLLSFLSVMALKDRSQSQESLALTSRKGSYPEALKVIQSLEKLASTEDEEELRASLSDLRKSTSPTLQESWKDFQQEGVASTHGEGSPTNNNPHSLSADDEECISEGVLSSHNAERKARVRSADEEDCNSPEVLPSQSEEGDEEVIPHEIDSSCHHSQVSESKLKEFVQEESEHCNSQDLDMESVAQIEEAATSGSDNYTSIQKDNSMDNLQVLENTNSAESLSVSGSERKYLSSAESAKSQKTNKSKKERKGNRSEMSSVRSTTSTNTGTKRVLSSTEALHLGVATSRGSTPRGHIADSQGPLPNVRKSMTPTNPGRIKKVATKPKSLHEDNLNTPKENLSGSISMPFLSAPPSDVHQYVDSWLEKMQPDTDIEGTTYLESERKAEFRIGTSSSERSEGIMSASAHFSPEEEGLSADENADDRPQELSGPVIQIRCDGELVDDSPLRMRSFCRSMPSVRIHPADQERQMRAHKSTEALFPLESESPQDTGSSFKGGMKPMLQQLCASMQSIRLAVSPTRHLSLEKARSLPDFSVQVASVFGASSTKLLSFLSVMTLKDGSSGRGSQPSLHSGQSSNSSEGLNSGKNSCPEALKVMQSLEKLANTEDEEELRASLSDLRKSTSPKFQESWKDFQEKYDIEDGPLESPKNVEREFALDVQSEASDQNEDQAFGIEQLMEELSMSEELRQEISSLVEGEMTYHDAEEPPTGTPEEGSQPETANTVIKADDVEEREQVEVMPVAYTDNVEKADSMDEDNVEEPSNIQTKTVKAFNSIEEGRSLSNGEESIKCEETGSRTGESEDIDNERFLTPLTESEPKDMDRDSESWKGHDTDHQSEEARYESGQEESVLKDIDRESASWKGHDTDHQSDEAKYESDQESVPKDMGRDSESWKGHDTDHQSDEAKYESDQESVPKDMDRDSESWKGHDTDHQSEEARYESGQEESVPKDMDRDSESWKGHDTDHQSDEAKSESDHVESDLAAEKEGRCGDKHDEEEEGHVQQSDDLGEEEEGHVQQSDDLGEEEEGHVQQSDDLGEEEEGHVQQSDDLGEDEDGTGLAKDKCSKKQADDLAQADALVEGQKDSLEGVDSCESHNDTHSENGLYPDEKEEENDQQGYPGVLLPGELSQELLAFVNKALLSSSLTFTYDSNGNLRIQPEVGEAKSITEMLDGKMNIDSQYGLKRLPSPNTSDLSDYRSDTADSGEKSQLSLDISTDVGDEEPDRVSTSHDQIDQNSEESDGKLSAITENGSATSPLGQKSNVTPKSDLKSVFSFNSNQDTASMVSHQDNTYLSSSLNGDSESVQCLSFYSQTDLREGVLIDKGRWLLKENHLIRTSPPLTMGMYDQVDSSSVDSGQDEDVPSSQYLNHQSPLAVISSSELEEMAKPSTPKCTYFTIPHSSDSDPFLNYKSSSNGSGRHGEVTRGNRVSPQEQPAKTWAKKNSSFSSFASVEFKLPDGKIHPQGGAAVERPARSQTIGGRTLQEEDSTESLQLRCGQNCPIL
ncbi:oxygen-regulated protein 1 [Alosa sapidissima]|uniref:oxygen-regulated protein 1 n=1 Tax=Alosa sapidissima TaxID=34773 RepID=UPI001C091BCE|nr:oxygen-regulated protein 1 [Alosa sapidissima]